jgi:hypothetical protein
MKKQKKCSRCGDSTARCICDTPTLVRIRPRLGWVKSNVAVVSFRAACVLEMMRKDPILARMLPPEAR